MYVTSELLFVLLPGIYQVGRPGLRLADGIAELSIAFPGL